MKKRNLLTKLMLDRTRFRSHLRNVTAASLVAAGMVSAILTLPLTFTLGSAPPAEPPVISYDQMQAMTTTIGGAQVQPTTRTVPHWFGSTLDPNNGVTYGYNMVGADPNNCPGAGCDVTITVDIIPLDVVVEGQSFNGSDVVDATLASPVFALNDYGSTPFATGTDFVPPVFYTRVPGGVLSQSDAGNQLQLLDATMRAQFNKTGSSSYHVRLNPVVHDAISIVVPNGRGILIQGPGGTGAYAGDVNFEWWRAQIRNLNGSLGYLDPTHLALYLTKDVVLFFESNPFNTGVSGFHGTSNNAYHGNANQPVQTFAWATYFSPGVVAEPNGGPGWAYQDIHILSHEIAEWADDPFLNVVEPWSTATAPQYGCSNLLETGDPVVGMGFAMGTNIYFQGPNPDGTQSADGYYHPEDEVFLPWFMRLAPNNISEPTQSPSSNVGRYTLMGDLNLFQSFHEPATGCN